ncbi:hypothetical protein JQ614_43400 [Bradyrhizobium diazoefficiens]|nr:hypothetical protein [Bradyrhizobium diazoefficiens]MBR0892854.1 hypothetical protein [Bradyrhizobium diazoefficiens]MBR0924527.1 hypothetical protein [Bradyrhizobium diazoefficiens]
MLFRPRDSFDQRLLDCQLAIKPDPIEIRWIHDVFGNCLLPLRPSRCTERRSLARRCPAVRYRAALRLHRLQRAWRRRQAKL